MAARAADCIAWQLVAPSHSLTSSAPARAAASAASCSLIFVARTTPTSMARPRKPHSTTSERANRISVCPASLRKLWWIVVLVRLNVPCLPCIRSSRSGSASCQLPGPWPGNRGERSPGRVPMPRRTRRRRQERVLAATNPNFVRLGWRIRGRSLRGNTTNEERGNNTPG